MTHTVQEKILMASGSEISLIVQIGPRQVQKGIAVRLVSFPGEKFV